MPAFNFYEMDPGKKISFDLNVDEFTGKNRP